MFPWRIEARNADRTLAPILLSAAGLCGALLLLIIVFLLHEAWPLLSEGSWKTFWRDLSWYPLEGQFDLMPMIWASLAAASGAVSLAAPLGLASAIFLCFIAPPLLEKLYRLVLILLAGIPSVVYGLWGLTVLVPLIARLQPPGASLLAAILILSLMILPTIALTSAASLAGVPQEWLVASQALGMSRRGWILGVALPAAAPGIQSGVLLAVARALGETMAVLMVAGNVVQQPTGLFEPVRVLTANIALEMAYATDLHRAGLFASGLLLTLLVLGLAYFASRYAARIPHV